MTSDDVDVTSRGAVLLGGSVVCDGFRFGHKYRVQTHIHGDHMDDFNSSKQFQDIFSTKATRDLLIAEFDADLRYRSNIVGVPLDTRVMLGDGHVLELRSSGHMLGAAQVAVERIDGLRVGYSGDFQWPIPSPIEVDTLVVDSTYGSPNKAREFTPEDAEARLLELVSELLKAGPVHIKGFRGTVQRALQVFAGELNAPILASDTLERELQVYREYGCAIDNVIGVGSDLGHEVANNGRFVQLYSKGDRIPRDGIKPMIVLSAFMSNPRDPVSSLGDGAYRVALSDHADFWGTLEYVRATGATTVVTDNTRGHGVDLALELQSRLGIFARPSSNDRSEEWGC